MFLLYANKTQLNVARDEPITSGSVNVYRVRFEFSPDWDGLDRVAVFTGSGQAINILLDESGECTIPWETLTKSGRLLEAGVYGTRGGEIVLPTVMANLGMIRPGVSPGSSARPPTPELWEQKLAQKGDRLDYTEDGDLGLYSGEKLLSAVPIAGGGEGGGGPDYTFGHGLKVDNRTVSVDMASSDNPDKTLPISAASVDATVGNIEILLKAIRGG